MISIVNFHGALQVAQNFTDDAVRLKAVLAGGAPSAPNMTGGAPDLTSTASLDAGSLFLAMRSLARNLASAPGRKTLMLFSTDSRLRPQEHVAKINAVLDACNRANVAIYGIDTGGFVASPTGFDGRVGVPPVACGATRGLGAWIAIRVLPRLAAHSRRLTRTVHATSRPVCGCFPPAAADS